MTRQAAISLGRSRVYRDVALWLIATYGVLKLADLPGDGGLKVLCGPWGCLPPLQALAAAHGFWLMVLGPALAWGGSRLSNARLRGLGIDLIAIGGAGIAATVVRSLRDWGPLTPERPWWHPAIRALFDVAMFVDLPVIEFVAAGIACVALARFKRKGNGDSGRSILSEPADGQEIPSVGDNMETQRDATHL